MSYSKEWAQICKGVNRGDYSLFETDATPEDIEDVRRIEAVFTSIPKSAAVHILERLVLGQNPIDPILMEYLKKLSADYDSVIHLKQRIKWLESATIARPSTSDFVIPVDMSISASSTMIGQPLQISLVGVD